MSNIIELVRNTTDLANKLNEMEKGQPIRLTGLCEEYYVVPSGFIRNSAHAHAAAFLIERMDKRIYVVTLLGITPMVKFEVSTSTIIPWMTYTDTTKPDGEQFVFAYCHDDIPSPREVRIYANIEH